LKRKRRPLFLDDVEEDGREDKVVELAAPDVQATTHGVATPLVASKKPSLGTNYNHQEKAFYL